MSIAIDDAGQLYVPLGASNRTVVEREIEVENIKETKT